MKRPQPLFRPTTSTTSTTTQATDNSPPATVVLPTIPVVQPTVPIPTPAPTDVSSNDYYPYTNNEDTLDWITGTAGIPWTTPTYNISGGGSTGFTGMTTYIYGDLVVTGNTLNEGDVITEGQTTTVGDLQLNKRVIATSGDVLIDPKTLSCAFTNVSATSFSTDPSLVNFIQDGHLVCNMVTADIYEQVGMITCQYANALTVNSSNFSNTITIAGTTYNMQPVTIGSTTLLAFVQC